MRLGKSKSLVVESLDHVGLEQLYNDDGPDGLASELSWAPTTSEPFYFEVDGLGSGTGTYRTSLRNDVADETHSSPGTMFANTGGNRRA